jgi:YD repeat-containing protein
MGGGVISKIIGAMGRGACVAAVVASVYTAQAGVNVNNGNFFISYTDLYVPTAGMPIDFTRTYNSRSNYVQGYFGVGWSSEVEGYLKINKNSISFYEGGGGNIVNFEPVKAGLWKSTTFGPQQIQKNGETYVLRTGQGKELQFNARGKLSKITDMNKNAIDFVYDSTGRLNLVKDNFNNQIRLTWKDFGKFPRIVAVEGASAKARFEYNSFGDLTKAIGADGIPFSYSYDDEHNMTKIGYTDGTTKELGYNKLKDWVTKFQDRDKSVTTYNYFSDTLDPENKFGTVVSRQMAGSKEKDSNRFWYEFKKRPDGSKYNSRSVTWIRGTTTETIFTECCGTPQAISQWSASEPSLSDSRQSWTLASGKKQTTLFEYHADGLLKKKTLPDGSFTQLAYDQKFKKVSSVTQNDRTIEYKYDPRGNLASAYDKYDNRKLDLTYDVSGRLTKVREAYFVGSNSQWRDVFFRYDGQGNPIEIKEKSQAGSEGIIRLSYSNSGEVTSVTNGKGRAISSESEVISARQVAATFQNLLDIIRPAGVTLTPEG